MYHRLQTRNAVSGAPNLIVTGVSHDPAVAIELLPDCLTCTNEPGIPRKHQS